MVAYLLKKLSLNLEIVTRGEGIHLCFGIMHLYFRLFRGMKEYLASKKYLEQLPIH